MKLKTIVFTVTALNAAMIATSAAAAPTIYTDPAAFAAANPGLTTYGFPASNILSVVTPPTYTLNGVSFVTPTNGFIANDGGYGTTPYFDSGSYHVVTPNHVLGLYLGAFGGAQTMSYTINGEAGTLALGAGRALSFLGFNSNGGPLDFSYSGGFEVDVTSFTTRVDTVPEPASWAFMLSGFAGAGTMMRRRRISASLA
ncbi:PEPxxWA-CTERM sorting domain-containing protein [Sphingosinicellaceae bacterium]|nr:PEPxxWA-CTERM sorting domain-containing protein [Sphingosinicellaceae bacterium]